MMVTNETPTSQEIVEIIELKASPERVFQAWTSQSEMVAWWLNVNKLENDLRVGAHGMPKGCSAMDCRLSWAARI